MGKKYFQKADPCPLPNSCHIYVCSQLFKVRQTLFVRAQKECKGSVIYFIDNFHISAVKFPNQKAGPPLSLLLELP